MTKKKHKKSHILEKNSDELFVDIREACIGLFYVSEIDAQFDVFAGSIVEKTTDADILAQLVVRTGEQVEVVGFDVFFGRLTTIKDWFGDRERLRVKKILDLKNLIEENLTDLRVFRIGRIQIRIYAVGTDGEGRLMGVSTHAVET